jgi:hypothetical protein
MPQLSSAFRLLLDARSLALDLSHDLWSFAIEVNLLYGEGVSSTDLRFLIHHGLVEHRLEVSSSAARSRCFSNAKGLAIPNNACFTLTTAGAELIRSLMADSIGLHHRQPYWDHNRRVLSVGDAVVKRFRIPARNQQLVLTAFQEEMWPPSILDPLPRDSNISPTRRLHDTINRLNRNQLSRLIHFHGNGSGTTVLWNLIA